MIGGREMYEQENQTQAQSISMVEYLNKRLEIRKRQENQRGSRRENSSSIELTELIV